MAAKTTTPTRKATKKAAAKKTTAKKAAPKKTAAKKAVTKKAATKKAASKKASAKTAAPKIAGKKAPARKAPAKKTVKKATAKVATPPAARKSRSAPAKERSIFLPRAIASVDDDDPLMAHGGGGGGFGRCGGRLLSNRLEQQLCNRLGIAGVVHSHSPRHYEIRYEEDNMVAAYAPMIVLRGRGREGKGVVIEAVEDPKAPILKKIMAFRAQYGQEFYVILVADEDSLDEIPLSAYDESCSSNSVHTLIARLAE